jgi:[acyl-carrier-protein] S-malonyltransferase
MPVTAFLFPGQGAQAVGMGVDACEGSAAARAVFDQVEETLGAGLVDIIRNGPAEALTRSNNAQPAILAVSIAYLAAMRDRLGSAMPVPALAAGHSLGEYTALVAVGALDLAVALRLVRRRGELMQAAAEATPSGMAAVLGMRLPDVEALCAEAGAQLANVNSAEQIVIAGATEALERAVTLAMARGARRAIALDVAGAFHTEVMRPAQEAMMAELASVDIARPTTPIIANSTALPISDPSEILQELERQICAPVLWQQTIERMAADGIERVVEVGPGKVLTGLARRIVPSIETANIGDLDSVRALA